MIPAFYKTLHADGSTPYGFGQYFIPKFRPGKRQKPIQGPLIGCYNGYHLCREKDLLYHLAEVICPVDVQGEDIIFDNDKVVVRQFRLRPPLETWNRQRYILFICDCIEHDLSFLGAWLEDETSIRDCIEAVRKFKTGRGGTAEQLLMARDLIFQRNPHLGAYVTEASLLLDCFASVVSEVLNPTQRVHPSISYLVRRNLGTLAGKRRRERFLAYLRGEV